MKADEMIKVLLPPETTVKITCIGIEKPFFMKLNGLPLTDAWLTNGTVYINTQNIIKIEVIENE